MVVCSYGWDQRSKTKTLQGNGQIDSVNRYDTVSMELHHSLVDLD